MKREKLDLLALWELRDLVDHTGPQEVKVKGVIVVPQEKTDVPVSLDPLVLLVPPELEGLPARNHQRVNRETPDHRARLEPQELMESEVNKALRVNSGRLV